MRGILIAFLPCVPLLAGELLWPLPDSRVLTGGFGDSRPDHFHGGVDIQTGGRSRPVVAPADGWIERMAVIPAGYGRALYLRLGDGRTAVFAHLARFVPPLETMLRDSQLAAGCYRVDVSFPQPEAPRCFRRGDTLAFTGSTGIGPAHFHFELREEAVQTDPLAAYAVRDHEPPVILRLAWVSLSAFSPASTGRAVNPPQSRQQNVVVQTREPVALLVQTFDPGPWGRNTVPAVLRVAVNDTVIFEDHPARVDLLGARDIYRKIVWAERRKAKRDIRRLFAVPPPREALSGSVLPGWICNVERARVTVEIADRTGNVTRQELEVTAGPWPGQASAIPPTRELHCGSFVLRGGDDPLFAWLRIEPHGPEGVRIFPDDYALGDRARLEYHLATGDSPRKKYFYELTASGRRALKRTESRNDSVMSCLILRAGIYGIGQDSEPPVLTLHASRNRLGFRLTDEKSGVDDRSIRCTVDGRTAIAEYEPDENGGFIWTAEAISRGTHEIWFQAADEAGNVREWREHITIP